MDDISNIMGNITRLLALVGGGLAAVAIAYAGIQWMTASGDPQKMAQVRMGVIGAVGGLILVGVAFIIPRVVSQLVVEPAGGVAFDWDVGFNCDQVLRDQLVVQRAASDADRMDALISQIQSQQEECSSETWNPKAKDVFSHGTYACFGGQGLAVFGPLTSVSRLKVGSSFVPRGLRVKLTAGYSIRKTSGRDARNNIIVYWHEGRVATVETPPSDRSLCWLYVSRTGVWSENY